MLETYHMSLATSRQTTAKERSPEHKTLPGKDQERLKRAILKEINNNLGTGAYKILSLKESQGHSAAEAGESHGVKGMS